MGKLRDAVTAVCRADRDFENADGDHGAHYQALEEACAEAARVIAASRFEDNDAETEAARAWFERNRDRLLPQVGEAGQPTPRSTGLLDVLPFDMEED